MLLVQAVSQHRQRRPGDAATSMLNLLSAYRAQPEEASKEGGAVGVVQWGEREELKDLYALFCAKVRAGLVSVNLTCAAAVCPAAAARAHTPPL
jgi:hypothetical protein